MIGLFQSLIDTVTSVIAFVIHSIDSLFNLLAHIPSYVSFLTVSIGFLPTIIIPFAIASISLYVVLMVLGRNK